MKKIIIFLFIIVFSVLFVKQLALAQATNNSDGFGFNNKLNDIAANAGYSPENSPTLDQRISSIVNIILSLVGVIFMILMIYGGYMWMTAGGDEKKVEKAQDVIRAGILGLIVVVAAYAISVFVISKLWGTTSA